MRPNKRPIDLAIATWIRAERKRLGMAEHDLAAYLHDNQGRISEYETGKRPVKPEHMEAFRALFG